MMKNLMILQGVLLLVAIMIIVATFIRVKRSKNLQNDVLKTCRDEISTVAWKRIYVAHPDHFGKFLKLIAYEGRGLLLSYPAFIKVKVASKDGSITERIYSKDGLHLEWIGNPSLGSGNLHWIKIGSGQDQLMICADTGINAITSREETADICRMIDQNFVLPEAALRDFALESNPASLTVVILFLSLIVFAIVDGAILNDYRLINKERVLWLMTPLFLMGIPCYFWLVKSRVPSRESLSLSMFLAISLAISFMPVIKRLDQVLAGSKAASYEYKLSDNASFEPVMHNAPSLSFYNTREYWSQFKKDSVHRFNLIHGPLGLWQVDESDLNKKYKEYYDRVHPK